VTGVGALTAGRGRQPRDFLVPFCTDKKELPATA